MAKVFLVNDSLYQYTNEVKKGRASNACDTSLQNIGTYTLAPNEKQLIAEEEDTFDIFWKSTTEPYWGHAIIWRTESAINIPISTAVGPAPIDSCHSLRTGRFAGSSQSMTAAAGKQA